MVERARIRPFRVEVPQPELDDLNARLAHPLPRRVARRWLGGVAVFPDDPSVRRFVEREYDVVHWSEFDRGGHFAAMEVPEILVEDIRAFFCGLR